MRKIVLFGFLLLSGLTFAQVGVGTENPESSAMFQVESSSKGVLITRVPLSGTNDTTTISSPTEGLLIYNTAIASFGDTAVSPGFYYYNGTEWKRLLNSGNVVSNTASITANTLAISNLPDDIFNGDATFNENLTVKKDLDVEGGVDVTGTITATAFVGDGSGLTGISTGVSSSTFKDSYLNIAIGTDMKSLTSSKALYEEDGITYFDNYEGYANIAIGENTLLSNTIGNYNTAIGFQALLNNKDGWSNVALGTYALKNNTEGYANIAIGEEVLLENTKGNYNVALGVSALYNNTTGDDNVAIGEYVLSSNTTGNENVAIGKYALENNTTGENNLAIGASALYNNSDGGYNVAIGNWPLQNNTEGNDNVAIGNWPLQNNTEGYDNVAIGKYALEVNTTGANNIAIGHYAGRSIDEDDPETLNGNNNIFLGPFTTIELDGVENSVAIGSGATLTQSNTIQLGNDEVSTVITSGTVSATAFVGDGSRLTGLEEIIFTGNASLTSNVYSATQDFIFGSNTTDDLSGTYDDARFYFLKAKAAFGAGYFPSLVSENGFLSSYDITDFDPYDVGDYSINLGYSNEASDLGAIAIGILNTTRAYGAKAMGDYLMANSRSEIVIGSYNEYSEDSERIVWNPLDPLFTVGNGDFSSDDKKRSNAFRILKNGDATFYDDLTVKQDLDVEGGINVTGTVTATAFVGDGSGLTDVPILDSSISSNKIVDASITSSKLADDSVTTIKIQNGTIVNEDVSSSAAISFTKLNIEKSDITGLGIPAEDTDTTYSAGDGLTLSGSEFSISNNVVTSDSDGNLSVDNYLDVSGDLYVSGTSIMYGGILMNGSTIDDLDVTDSFYSQASVSYFENDVDVSGDLYVSGTSIMYGGISMNGSTIDNLDVTDSFYSQALVSYFEYDVDVLGDLYVSGTLNMYGDISMNGSTIDYLDVTDSFYSQALVSYFDYDVDVSGDLVVNGTATVNGSAVTSDQRLKTAIQDIEDASAQLVQLKPKRYMKKRSLASNEYTIEEIGFLAQDIQKLLPYLVKEGSDPDKLLSLDYNSFIALLTKGFQEQSAKMEAQTTKLNQLEERLKRIEKLLNENQP